MTESLDEGGRLVDRLPPSQMGFSNHESSRPSRSPFMPMIAGSATGVPVMPSQVMAGKDLESRMISSLRGLTNPNTGHLDEDKIVDLPVKVQAGLRAAVVTADTIGQSIESAGYSKTGAMAHRNQVFMNMALHNVDVLRYATETVMAQPNLPTSTQLAATRQLAALPAPGLDVERIAAAPITTFVPSRPSGP